MLSEVLCYLSGVVSGVIITWAAIALAGANKARNDFDKYKQDNYE